MNGCGSYGLLTSSLPSGNFSCRDTFLDLGKDEGLKYVTMSILQRDVLGPYPPQDYLLEDKKLLGTLVLTVASNFK